jgi:hypothetical protein
VASAGSTSSRGTDEGYWLPVTVRRERAGRRESEKRAGRREKGEDRREKRE